MMAQTQLQEMQKKALTSPPERGKGDDASGLYL
jgi:hypothetical protein